MTIVKKCLRFIYNRLLVVIYTSGCIFQAKGDELLSYIDGVGVQIGYILVLSKDNFPKHIGQIIVIFDRLCNAGLESNATKLSFWLKEIK